MKLIIPEKIETDRLILRKLRPEDAERIFYVYASKPAVTKYVYWRMHQTMEDTRSFIKSEQKYWSRGQKFSFGVFIKKSSRMIGEFGIHNFEAVPQISYAFGPVHWGNGFATEACNGAMKVLSELDRTDWVETFVDLENLPSKNVLMRCGFEEDETRGDIYFPFANQKKVKKCALFTRRLKISTTQQFASRIS